MSSDVMSYGLVYDDIYVSNQGKLYKNAQYLTLIKKRLFNVAPNKYGELVSVYDTSVFLNEQRNKQV